MSASLALSIDCDGCTVARLEEVFRVWAVDLGLPVASSMFLFSRNPGAPPQASYLDGDRDALLGLYRRGWIDTLHAMGDLGTPVGRKEAERAFEALRADGVRLEVWTNHGAPGNPHNFALPSGRGDVPGSDAYVADLVREHGVRFVWVDDLTHLVGQDREAGKSEYYRTYPGASPLKKTAARLVSESGVRKLNLQPFQGNRLTEPLTLRDGSGVLKFRRFGRWRVDTISDLPELLSPDTLDALSEKGGTLALYLHIGPSRGETPESFRAGLRTLEAVARRKEIRVMKTSELLRASSGK